MSDEPTPRPQYAFMDDGKVITPSTRSMEYLTIREYFALHLACAMMSSGISQHPRSAISAAIEEVDRFLEELAK